MELQTIVLGAIGLYIGSRVIKTMKQPMKKYDEYGNPIYNNSNQQGGGGASGGGAPGGGRPMGGGRPGGSPMGGGRPGGGGGYGRR